MARVAPEEALGPEANASVLTAAEEGQTDSHSSTSGQQAPADSASAPPPQLAKETSSRSSTYVLDPDGKDMEFQEIPSLPLNLYALVLERVDLADSSATALYWSVVGLVFVICQVLCLLAISLTMTWAVCLDGSSCKAGMACVQEIYLPFATCEDCRSYWPTPTDPWKALVRPIGVPVSPDGNVTTATMHCGAQLQAAQQMEEMRCQQAFWFSTSMVQDCIDASRPSGYETCLHVDQAFRRITWLDYCIICFVFAVISASTAAERYQQCCMESVSKVVSPGPIKLLQDIKERKVKFESISSTVALLVRRGIVPIVLWLSELAVHFALLPSIVMTMVLLFVNTSLDAVTVVLNGVAITFLCHLDDFSLSLLVDDLERQHLQDFIIGRFYQNHEFSAPDRKRLRLFDREINSAMRSSHRIGREFRKIRFKPDHLLNQLASKNLLAARRSGQINFVLSLSSFCVLLAFIRRQPCDTLFQSGLSIAMVGVVYFEILANFLYAVGLRLWMAANMKETGSFVGGAMSLKSARHVLGFIPHDVFHLTYSFVGRMVEGLFVSWALPWLTYNVPVLVYYGFVPFSVEIILTFDSRFLIWGQNHPVM